LSGPSYGPTRTAALNRTGYLRQKRQPSGPTVYGPARRPHSGQYGAAIRSAISRPHTSHSGHRRSVGAGAPHAAQCTGNTSCPTETRSRDSMGGL